MKHIKSFEELSKDNGGLKNKTPKTSWYKKPKIIAAIIGAIALIAATIISTHSPDNSSNNDRDTNSPTIEKTTKLESDTPDKKNINTIVTLPLTGYEQADSMMTQIRKEKKLRQLSVLESGKALKDIPNNTYSYLSAVFLEVDSNYQTFQRILTREVDRFKKARGTRYEIHKVDDNEIYLCGFVSQETASNISHLTGDKEHEFVLTGFPLNKNDDIAFIPIDRIINADYRVINIEINRDIIILDIRIK